MNDVLMTEVLPEWAICAIRDFMRSNKTGQVTLHIKDGEVLKTQETAYREKPKLTNT